MRKNWIILTIIVLHSFLQKGFGQEDYVVNQSKFLQKSNPSFLGMNQLNRVGVLYNSLRINESTAMDNKYAFGSVAFQDKNVWPGHWEARTAKSSPLCRLEKCAGQNPEEHVVETWPPAPPFPSQVDHEKADLLFDSLKLV